MEKNIAKQIYADIFLIMHQARGRQETQRLYHLLQQTYQSRQMKWQLTCLELAWEQYNYWQDANQKPGLTNRYHPPRRIATPNVPTGYPIRLEKRGHYTFEFAWPGEILALAQQLNQGLQYSQKGHLKQARQIYNAILKQCDYHIDALNMLAMLEWDNGNLLVAENYYLKAYQIGQTVLPDNFQGLLPWAWCDNRPFLRAMHGLALTKLRLGHLSQAKQILRQLLQYDPDDPLGVHIILNDT